MRSSRRPARRGTIESVDGSTLVIKQDDGPDVTVKLADNAQVFGVVPATLADVKIGDFIGVGAMPQPDGSQKAIQVMIFARIAARHSAKASAVGSARLAP